MQGLGQYFVWVYLRLVEFRWWLKFFVMTRGCTELWLARVWSDLIERDIHPDEPLELYVPGGRTIDVSAFGSQLWCRLDNGYQFALNWSDLSQLYLDEKWGAGDWERAYNQRGHILRSTAWVATMKLLDANLVLIDDRSGANTVDYRTQAPAAKVPAPRLVKCQHKWKVTQSCFHVDGSQTKEVAICELCGKEA